MPRRAAPGPADDSAGAVQAHNADVAGSAAGTSIPSPGDGEALDAYLRNLRGRRQPTQPTAEEELALALRACSGDLAARQALAAQHLPAVVTIAKRYLGRGLPLADLVEEGNVGLLHAVARFEPTRGVRLATFASWWVRQAIEQALAQQARLVRLPLKVLRDVASVLRAQRWLQSNGPGPQREADAAAVAAHLGRDVATVQRLLQWTQPLQSLESPEPGPRDGLAPTPEQLPDPDTHHDPEALHLDHELRAQALACLQWLTPREREVLAARFGLHGDAPQSLEAIAQGMSCTRERVRQIQQEAMHKLRRVLERQGIHPEAFF